MGAAVQSEDDAPAMVADDPKPGSYAAAVLGCTCSVELNHHGLGVRGDGAQHGWRVRPTCRLHGDSAPVFLSLMTKVHDDE